MLTRPKRREPGKQTYGKQTEMIFKKMSKKVCGLKNNVYLCTPLTRGTQLKDH